MQGFNLVFADIRDFAIKPMGQELIDLPFIITPRLFLKFAVTLHIGRKELFQRDLLAHAVLSDIGVLSPC